MHENKNPAIKINDNHEPLVDIKKYCPNIIIDIGKERLKVEKTAYLRKTVAKMLRRAQKDLPEGWSFIVNDAWRPAYVQAKIYFDFIKRFSKKYPRWSRKRVLAEVDKYVAPWKGKIVSGHMSGGAIDLRLVDRRGRKIPIKSEKLNYQQNALSDQKFLPAYIRRNREILFLTLCRAGLSNYPKEYWHWSYGDYQWAKRNNKSIVIYGVVPDYLNLYASKSCSCGSGKKFKKCHGK